MPARTGSGWKTWAALALLAVVAGFALSGPHAPSAPAQAPAQHAPARDDGNPLALPPPMPPTVAQGAARDEARIDVAYPDFLPPEAVDTLRLIARGGPYPHRQDDATFGNRERRLPPRPRGYYREYTVETPGSRDRGARRIIAGGQPPTEFFYTDDHYRSFRRFTLDAREAGR
ncbi:MAG: ribonuclease domain-containing protein [Lysobacteraceae bacterium]